MKLMDEDVKRYAPQYDYAKLLDPNGPQTHLLRRVLKSFTEVSRPSGRRAAAAEAVFRPTFCRFLLDSNLVDLRQKGEGYLPYHLAVQFFDAAASTSESPVGSLKSASLEQCTIVISQLLGHLDIPAQPAWAKFESGIALAQDIMNALLVRSKQRAEKQILAAELENMDDLQMQRRVASSPGMHLRLFGSQDRCVIGLKVCTSGQTLQTETALLMPLLHTVRRLRPWSAICVTCLLSLIASMCA